MKKSQLRKIIRESIQQLMNVPNTLVRNSLEKKTSNYYKVTVCWCGGSTGFGLQQDGSCMKPGGTIINGMNLGGGDGEHVSINGQPPVQGQYFKHSPSSYLTYFTTGMDPNSPIIFKVLNVGSQSISGINVNKVGGCRKRLGTGGPLGPSEPISHATGI